LCSGADDKLAPLQCFNRHGATDGLWAEDFLAVLAAVGSVPACPEIEQDCQAFPWRSCCRPFTNSGI
jgi:hypothetical protein